MADRVYAPWPDYEEKLRSAGEPLRAIESERALAEFDFLGVSLQYELSYSNILTILDLAHIPLYAGERTSRASFCHRRRSLCIQSRAAGRFFRFFRSGRGRRGSSRNHRCLQGLETRAPARSREDFLIEIRKIAGVYIPSFFDVSYGADGIISAVVPRFSDYTHVRKRVVSDLDQSCPIPEKPLVPLIDIVHNRLRIEIARGCTRGCRFCQASFIYRPVRERHPLYVFDAAKKALASSGFEDVSLLSLSTGDYCQIQDLLGALVKELEPRKIAVSFPSMRVGTLTPELMEHIKKVRKTGFTLAPEAGSERLQARYKQGNTRRGPAQCGRRRFRSGLAAHKTLLHDGSSRRNRGRPGRHCGLVPQGVGKRKEDEIFCKYLNIHFRSQTHDAVSVVVSNAGGAD